MRKSPSRCAALRLVRPVWAFYGAHDENKHYMKEFVISNRKWAILSEEVQFSTKIFIKSCLICIIILGNDQFFLWRLEIFRHIVCWHWALCIPNSCRWSNSGTNYKHLKAVTYCAAFVFHSRHLLMEFSGGSCPLSKFVTRPNFGNFQSSQFYSISRMSLIPAARLSSVSGILKWRGIKKYAFNYL